MDWSAPATTRIGPATRGIAPTADFSTGLSNFATDPTAKEYQKRWLRYAVARWGHSPAIMAWELFNEVEWVDAVQTDRDWPTVICWHAEMAAFLRELDPYHHLVTTSAAWEQPELYRAMDYFQPVILHRDVFNGIKPG